VHFTFDELNLLSSPFFRHLPVAALKIALKAVLKTAVMEHAIPLIVAPTQQTLPMRTCYSPQLKSVVPCGTELLPYFLILILAPGFSLWGGSVVVNSVHI
jgi:hypothetical protein